MTAVRKTISSSYVYLSTFEDLSELENSFRARFEVATHNLPGINTVPPFESNKFTYVFHNLEEALDVLAINLNNSAGIYCVPNHNIKSIEYVDLNPYTASISFS